MCSRSHLVLKSQASALARYDRSSFKLGEGCFGIVFKSTDKHTGSVRAMKIMSKAKDSGDLARREAKMMASLDHPGLIRLYEMIEDSANFYLVTELCNGGDLQGRLEAAASRVEESVAAPLMRNILRAVHYMQGRNITHSDFAPRNIILVNDGPLEGNEAKIADFGTAYVFDPAEGPQKADLWSSGLILREFVCGPVKRRRQSDNSNSSGSDARSPRAPTSPTSSDPFSPSLWAGVSTWAQDLCRRLLRRDPSKRWTAEEALHHPWFRECCQDDVRVPLPDDLVQRIKAYSACSRLQQLGLKAVAEHIPGDAVKDLIWSALDQNGDGLVTAKELVAVVRASGLACPTPGEIQVTMTRIDPDETGVLERAFLFGALICPMDGEEILAFDYSSVQAAFRVLDTDRDGLLSTADVRELLPNATDQEIRAWIASADDDKDGALNLDEFEALVQQPPKIDPRAHSISKIHKTSALRQLKIATVAGHAFRTVETDPEAATKSTASFEELNDLLGSAGARLMKDMAGGRTSRPTSAKTKVRAQSRNKERVVRAERDRSNITVSFESNEGSDALESVEMNLPTANSTTETLTPSWLNPLLPTIGVPALAKQVDSIALAPLESKIGRQERESQIVSL